MGNNFLDDPEWRHLKERLDRRPKLKPQKMSSGTVSESSDGKHESPEPFTEVSAKKNIQLTFNVGIPQLKLSPKYKKIGIAGGALLVIAVAGFVGTKYLMDKPNPSDSSDVLSESVTEPEFDTVLPQGKKEETEDNQVRYDPQKKVASFRDSVDNVPITISQQPLPEPFKTNPDEEVRKLAEGFSANQVLNESNPKAYIGIDVSGAQTVIFHKKGVLVFILSTKEIDKDSWAQYITQLL